MASNSTSSESKELEQALRDLDPAGFDQEFLARLEAAADGSLTTLTPGELQFEKSLQIHQPAALDADFLGRLESVVAGMPFAVDEKIVLFPNTAPLQTKPAKRHSYARWGAAAAVALIGGVTALMIPAGKPGATASRKPVISSPAMDSDNSSNFVPAGFHSELGGTADEGVSWHQSDKPHRVYRVTYLDHMTLKNAEGKTIEVDQPRTEYIFVPEKMD